MARENLRDLLIYKLSLLSYMEHRGASALPGMIDRAHHQMLKAALREHLAETRNHVCRVEDAFKAMRERPARIEVRAISAILEDAEDSLRGVRDAHIFDAVIIFSARCIEHYEIAAYTAAAKWAELIGEKKVAHVLKSTLAEEESADKVLSDILNTISQRPPETAKSS